MPIRATFTADVTSLRTALSQGEVKVNTFATTIDATNRRLSTFGERFSGARVIRDAETMTRALTAVGGASQLTDTQLKRVNATLQEAAQAYERTGREAPKAVQRLTSEVNQLATAQQKVAATAQQMSSGFSVREALGSFSQGLGVGAGAGAGLAAIQTAGSFVRGLADDAARLTPLRESFERLQGSSGAAAESLRDMREASRGLVGEADLLLAANKATQLELTKMGIDMGELTSISVRLGRAMGQDATSAIDDFTTALGRKSTMILDNLGITLKMEEAELAYATSLGKTVEALTDEEKSLAFAIAAMEKARAKAKELEDQQLTLADQGGRVVRVITDLTASFGSSLNAGGLFSGMLGGVADAMTRIGEDYEKLQRRVARANEGAGLPPATISDVANVAASGFLVGLGGAQAIPGLSSLGATTGEYLFTQTALRRGAKLPLTPSTSSPAEQARLAAFGERAPLSPLSFFSARRSADDAKQFEEQWRKAQEAAAKATEDAGKRHEAALAKVRAEQDKLIGVDRIRAAEQLATNIQAVGTHRVDPKGIPELASTLLDAESRARALGIALKHDVGETIEELVRTPAYREFFRNLQTPPAIFDTLAAGRSVIAGAVSRETLFGGIIPGGNPALGVNRDVGRFGQGAGDLSLVGGISGALQPRLDAGLRTTRNWRIELQSTAQAFAQLAQAAGPALDRVNRGMAITLTSANAASTLLDALDQAIGRDDTTGANWLRNKDGSLTKTGSLVGGGIAGASTGLALGSLTSSLFAGGALGAGGGFASGALATGTLSGGFTGLAVGALTGIWAANRNRQQQRAQLDQLREDAITSAGSLEQLQRNAERAGFSVEEFMRRFHSSSPREFAAVMNELNQALAQQAQRALALSRALEGVKDAQGVLSPQQLAQIRTTPTDGDGVQAIVEFDAGQQQQTLAGIVRAAEALARLASLTDEELERITEGITDSDERRQRIEDALRARADSVMSTLGPSVQATATAIFVSIEDALASGERLVDVLRILGPAIVTVKDLFERSGRTPGAGFQQVASYQAIASDPQTGGALEVATGLGQALAGFANRGLLSPALFGELANGIGAAYKQMELLGKGGLDAARLMQPALQSIWQMVQDYPGMEDQLDDDTKALLDFAVKSGLVGDQFRPAIDRMVAALNRLIDRMDIFLRQLSEAAGVTLPTPPAGGEAGGGQPGGGAPGGGQDSQGDGGNGGEYGGTLSVRPFARGGLVTRPTIGLVGEAGPELITPLDRVQSLLGGGGSYTFNTLLDGKVIASATVRYLPHELEIVGASWR